MSKRKRVVLNFQQKLEILQQLKEGKSGAVLARQYGIGTSTISDIKRNSEVIVQFVSNFECEQQVAEKKTRKTARNIDLDSKIYKWYSEAKKNGVYPPDPAICAKALEVNKQLTNGIQDFKASPGWLRHFKNRHGIKEVKEQREESVCTHVVKQLRNVVKRGGYTLENVYNADDGFLLWKSLPNCENKGISGVSVIACANANASHKLPLCVIGSDKKFTQHSNLSVIYKVDNNNDLNVPFFENWFEEVFVPQVKNRQAMTGNMGKVLLIIDDSSSHPLRDVLIKDRDDIDVFVVPDEVTPSIQPMEINQFKIIYRRKLLELLVTKSPYPIKQFLEEFTFQESISLISEAWDSIPRTQIVQSWSRLLSDSKNETEPSHNGMAEILEIAQKIQGLDHCNSEEIKHWLESDDFLDHISEDNEGVFEENEICIKEEGPSDLEAYQCFDTVIQWVSRQTQCDSVQLSTLENLRDLAAAKLCGTMKQEVD